MRKFFNSLFGKPIIGRTKYYNIHVINPVEIEKYNFLFQQTYNLDTYLWYEQGQWLLATPKRVNTTL
jgi:hypothetical protein